MEQIEYFQDRIKENGNLFRLFTVSDSLHDLCLPILPLKRFGSDYSPEMISKNVLEKTNEEEEEEEEKNFLSFAYLFYFYLPTLIFIGLPKHIFKLMKRGGRIPAPYSTIPYSGITRSFPLYLPVKLGRRRRRNLNPLSTARDRRNHDEKKNLLLRPSTFGKRISKFRSNGKIGESVTRGETESRY